MREEKRGTKTPTPTYAPPYILTMANLHAQATTTTTTATATTTGSPDATSSFSTPAPPAAFNCPSSTIPTKINNNNNFNNRNNDTVNNNTNTDSNFDNLNAFDIPQAPALDDNDYAPFKFSTGDKYNKTDAEIDRIRQYLLSPFSSNSRTDLVSDLH
jgi:hypothetical protein